MLLVVLRILLTPVAVVAIVASANFAFEFGWSKGATTSLMWTFAVLFAALDIAKAFLPILASIVISASRRIGIWLCYFFLTFASLWAAWGVNAIQLSERVGIKASAQSDQQNRRATLERLKAERAALPRFEFATEESVRAADAAVKAAESAVQASEKAIEQECKSGIGENCRRRQAEATQRRADVVTAIAAKTKVIRDKATTDQVVALDAKIQAAEAAYGAVDVRAISTSADPQATAMAKTLGTTEDRISTTSFLIGAVLVEIGCLLLWFLYGHGEKPAPAPLTSDPSAQQITPVYEQTFPQIETPADSRAKFFRQCVFPAEGQRVSGSSMYAAYQKFCADEGLQPMSVNVFGRNPPVDKERAGGTVWYLNVALATGYSVAQPVLRVVGGSG